MGREQGFHTIKEEDSQAITIGLKDASPQGLRSMVVQDLGAENNPVLALNLKYSCHKIVARHIRCQVKQRSGLPRQVVMSDWPLSNLLLKLHVKLMCCLIEFLSRGREPDA